MTPASMFRGPRSDEYETPGWLIDPLRRQYDFGIDLAATASNTVVPRHFSAGDSFLDNNDCWSGVAWCNPPFSLAAKFFDGMYDRGAWVAIYKSSNMETAVWRHIFRSCDWICHPHRRVNYCVGGVEKKGAQFPSAVVGHNVEPPIVAWPHTILEVRR